MKYLQLLLILSLAFIIISCGDDDPVKTAEYPSVKIGDQTWMKENFDEITFANGDTIKHVTTAQAWNDAFIAGEAAWCYYDFDEANGPIYGKLYNWYAVNDSRSLAPAGWKTPTLADWNQLGIKVGGGNVAGHKLREKGTSHWDAPNNGATDEYGFTALPGGICNTDGSFEKIGSVGAFWTSSGSETDNDNANLRTLKADSSAIYSEVRAKGLGLSVRCIRN